MNKSQFIKILSQCCGLTQAKCSEVLIETYKLICENLKQGESVVFKGFGKFFVKTKRERFVKNVNTNNLHLIGCRNVPCFKIGKQFKQEIR